VGRNNEGSKQYAIQFPDQVFSQEFFSKVSAINIQRKGSFVHKTTISAFMKVDFESNWV
jgi:hypothetical protein